MSSQPRPSTSGGNKVHNPSPPVGMYVNSGAARAASAHRRATNSMSRPSTAGSTLPSRPGTAEATVFNKKLRKNRTFLKDNEAAGQLLPQPLPNGIPYVAQFTTFDDLIDRKILQQTEAQQVHLTTSDVQLMYEAKCMDQNLKPTWEREVRFMELLSGNCKGSFFTLRENGLGHASAEAIARVLAQNENYSIVDLGGNRFRDAGARCIAQLLLMNESIVHLSLKSNDIGHHGGEAIALALEQNSTLTSLDLGGISGINRNHLGSHGAAALGQMLAVNPVLAYLNVSSNGLGVEGIEKLAQGLSDGGNTTLISFNLASNNLGTDGCQKLGPALESTRIETLDLQRNATGDKGTAYLCRHIKSGTWINSCLTELNLDSNNIRELGAKALGRFIGGTQKLVTLSLNDNPLTLGVNDIADALKSNRSIKELRLSHCMLTDKEATALAKMFDVNPTLTNLDLSKNGIGNTGAKVIADSLRANNYLQVLSLASNGIGDQGGEAISLMIRENQSLSDLSIRQNLMGPSGNMIEEQLRKNSSIRKLDFSYNDFNYQAYAGIGASLSRNQAIWNKAEIPRLNLEIEELGSAHDVLRETQAKIDDEKQLVRQRTDDCSRLRETINSDATRNRKFLDDLKEQNEEAYEEEKEKEKLCITEKQQFQNTVSTLEREVNRIRDRADRQHSQKEAYNKEMTAKQKELHKIQEAEAEALRPLLEQHRKAMADRKSDMEDAKWQAENLVNTEMKIAQLERQMGLDKPSAVVNAPPPVESKPGRGGSAKPKRR